MSLPGILIRLAFTLLVSGALSGAIAPDGGAASTSGFRATARRPVQVWSGAGVVRIGRDASLSGTALRVKPLPAVLPAAAPAIAPPLSLASVTPLRPAFPSTGVRASSSPRGPPSLF